MSAQSSESITTRLAKVCEDIKGSIFVCVDFEMGGIKTSRRNYDDVQSYFEAAKQVANKYALLQMGITIAKLDLKESVNFNNDVWESSTNGKFPFTLSNHQFYLRNSSKEMVFDNNTIDFLILHHFDLGEWSKEALNCLTLSELHMARRNSPLAKNIHTIHKEGLQNLVKAIVDEGIPLVVHNGFMDIMFLYTNFIGSFPDTFEDFRTIITGLFDGGIYDTKFIYKALQNTNESHEKPEEFNLLGIYNATVKYTETLFPKMAQPKIHHHLKAKQKIEPFTENFAHSAGFDSYMTAIVFIYEIFTSLIYKANDSDSRKKVKKISTTINAELIETLGKIQQFKGHMEAFPLASKFLLLSDD